jgi:hypothetical protein
LNCPKAALQARSRQSGEHQFFDLADEQRGRQGIAVDPPAMQNRFRVGCAHSAGAVEVLLAVIV